MRIIVDNMDIEKVNLVNLRAASSAALLLLPSKFTEVLLPFLLLKLANITYFH